MQEKEKMFDIQNNFSNFLKADKVIHTGAKLSNKDILNLILLIWLAPVILPILILHCTMAGILYPFELFINYIEGVINKWKLNLSKRLVWTEYTPDTGSVTHQWLSQTKVVRKTGPSLLVY
jgi:hypothetical protein